MTDRRENGRPRRDSRVKDWETLETIVKREEDIGRQKLGVQIVIDQPILDNDRRGFKRVATKLNIGDRFIRLNTKGLMALCDLLTEERSAILAAVDKVHADNEELERERRSRSRGRGGHKRGSGRGGDSLVEESRSLQGQVGGGLSRFSGESKRERKRDKKRRKREEEQEKEGNA
jgi:hypothetical protein